MMFRLLFRVSNVIQCSQLTFAEAFTWWLWAWIVYTGLFQLQVCAYVINGNPLCQPEKLHARHVFPAPKPIMFLAFIHFRSDLWIACWILHRYSVVQISKQNLLMGSFFSRVWIPGCLTKFIRGDNYLHQKDWSCLAGAQWVLGSRAPLFLFLWCN